ncbi:hypothetical protein CKK34_6687 [Yarrowia sp. E02]|nr:hypothetical protein CKK34_6687 [Yarrowia sp. E02]
MKRYPVSQEPKFIRRPEKWTAEDMISSTIGVCTTLCSRDKDCGHVSRALLQLVEERMDWMHLVDRFKLPVAVYVSRFVRPFKNFPHDISEETRMIEMASMVFRHFHEAFQEPYIADERHAWYWFQRDAVTTMVMQNALGSTTSTFFRNWAPEKGTKSKLDTIKCFMDDVMDAENLLVCCFSAGVESIRDLGFALDQKLTRFIPLSCKESECDTRKLDQCAKWALSFVFLDMLSRCKKVGRYVEEVKKILAGEKET